MQKESKIKEILNVRKWDGGSRGVTFYFTVLMENGDKGGGLGRKSEDGLKVGDMIKYTIDDSKGHVDFKEIRENKYGGGKGYTPPSKANLALGYATELAVANIAKSDKPLEMTSALAKKITGVADEFLTWLKAND